ncbi:MAG: MFS transporter [Chloroflexi bacterium]|nr:MFS transporter [Chloroflexota bacterium]
MTTISSEQATTRNGMRTFTIIWLGQLISFIGSGLTGFALGVWIYQTTGSITELSLITMFNVIPEIVFGPLVGPLVDRWNRRWVMILSDSGAALSTLAIVLLLLTGRLETWHIYIAVFVSSTFGSLQWPALMAAITQLVPKQQFGRAGGLLQIVRVGRVLISPLLAGVLIEVIQLQGVILIDFVTFLFALLTLLSIRIPDLQRTAEGQARKGSLLREAIYGWSYIWARPGLLILLIYITIASLLISVGPVLLTPLVLSFASPAALGTMISLSGIGYLVGSVVMSAWGGPQRRIQGVLGFMLLLGLMFTLSGLRASIPLITAGLFGAFFCLPIIVSSNQAIWQAKVAPDVQGRVFAIQEAIRLVPRPLVYLLIGPLADRVFEPLLAADGPLAGSVGRIIGVGPGRGIGFLFVSLGLFFMILAALAYLYPRLRLIEDELPDAVPEEPAQAGLSVPAVEGITTD